MTPLAKYLKKYSGITAADIGRRMARYLDAPPSSASLSQWVTGVTAPSANVQWAMSIATCRVVSPEAWHKWKLKKRRDTSRRNKDER